MIKIKDNVDLKELEKFGFEKSNHYIVDKLEYEFLIIDMKTRKIEIDSGLDEVYSDKELIKLYDLIQAGLVEKVVE